MSYNSSECSASSIRELRSGRTVVYSKKLFSVLKIHRDAKKQQHSDNRRWDRLRGPFTFLHSLSVNEVIASLVEKYI